MLLFADPVGQIYASAAQAASGLYTTFTGTIHTSGLPSGNIGPTAATFGGPRSGSITVPTSSGPYTFGMRFISTSAYTSGQEICTFFDTNNDAQAVFGTNSGGSITAYRGAFNGPVLGTSSGTVMIQNVWDYVEFQVTVSATNGTVAVRINGSTVLNLTNVNTLGGGGAAVIGKIAIGSNQANFVQDIYISDANGSYNIGFLGDVHISVYNPTSNGAYTQYTPNPNTNALWQCVSAATPTDSSVFASDSNPGDKMSVNLAPSSVAGTIAGVIVVGRMEKTIAERAQLICLP